MRKSNTQTIGQVLREYVKSLRIGGKLKEIEIIHEWEALLGRSVSQRTRKIYIRDKTLYVELSSSVVKNELMMLRNDIKNRLNEKAGEIIVENIVLR